MNRCCLVVLVAVYPKKDTPTDLFLADFSLSEVDSDIPVRPESATVVAAKLAKKKNPSGGVDVTTVASIGYESGTYIDPVTGQPTRAHGVNTSVGVGVSPAPTTPPEVADHDREVMERELYEKALPEAKVSIPVAGYLYFPIPAPTKNTKYKLTYTGQPDPITLTLP